MKYDYIIVGAGLFGSVFAYLAKQENKRVLVIDKRSHIGGNIYTKEVEGINVHFYGAHIFHTSDHEVWDFMNQFASFNHFINSPLALYKNKLFNLPFNMHTFNQLWGVTKPSEARKIIEKQQVEHFTDDPHNLEEQAINMVGIEIYEKLIKGYTEKQWGTDCKNLPPSIIKRIPVRYTYNNNYFNDIYQGIPIGGYTKIIDKMLSGVEVLLNTDYFDNRDYYHRMADKIVYTGRIDQFYNYQFGPLEYRSLRFDHQVLNTEDYQGNAVINFTEKEVPFTRIIEHKHFEYKKVDKTVITKEYPRVWNENEEAYYPINDKKNQETYDYYKEKSLLENHIVFGGRLAEFKYYDMDQVIKSAILTFKHEKEKSD